MRKQRIEPVEKFESKKSEQTAEHRREVQHIQLDEVLQRLGKIEAVLTTLAQQRKVKDWYTTAEVAQFLGKAEFTVREWCRQGRIHAEKKGSGRGKYQNWVVSHAELLRYEREGLLPL